jgi:hypothetical protein
VHQPGLHPLLALAQAVLSTCPKLLSCQPESLAAKAEGLGRVLGLDQQQARDLVNKWVAAAAHACCPLTVCTASIRST